MIKKGREKEMKRTNETKGKDEIDGLQNFRIGFKKTILIHFRIQLRLVLKRQVKGKSCFFYLIQNSIAFSHLV